MNPLLELKDLHTWFPVKGGVLQKVQGWVKAVNGVSLSVGVGEVVAVVGESGCGKSSLAKTLCALVPKHSGEVFFAHENRRLQMIFQDPYSSLNPRHTVFEILAGPLRCFRLRKGPEVRKRCLELLDMVGLPASALEKFPHAFSGGQRQRIAIARSLATEPSLLICDEVTAALDVSVQAQIVELLRKLKEELGLSLLFISHDLSLVRAVSDRIHVMYLGRVVESASPEELFSDPRHPYTSALLDAIPSVDLGAGMPKALLGEIPSPLNLPKGCFFAGRCSRVEEKCHREYPLETGKKSRKYSCFFPLNPQPKG